MGRYRQAPSGFTCPYRDSCPHLQGLSTQWTYHRYQEAARVQLKYWRMRDDYEAEGKRLRATIRELEKENAELKARLTALHQRQFKAGKRTQSSAQQSDSCATRRSRDPPKKRGAPLGHPGWHRRKPDHVDEEATVPAPDVCPRCGCEHLTPSEEIKEHLQEDIVLQPRTWVTKFMHRQAVCPQCHHLVLQAAEGELLDSDIGPTTKATAVFLRYGMRLSYRKVRELFDVLFGMPLVPASAMNFDRAATRKGEPLYEDVKQKIRFSPVVYADETHWRENGRNSFVWYGGNENLALFHIEASRAGLVAQHLFGEQFGGSLVTDGYAAYNAVNASSRQTCLAHLIRKANEIAQGIELLPQEHRDHEALRFCQSIADVLRDACEVGRKRDRGSCSMRRAARLLPQLYSRVDTICSTPLAYEPAEQFRRRLLDPKREYPRLFTFLSVPNLAPTNNHAERALRTPVIFRKICFGTRSSDGSRSHSVLPSLLVTAQRQGKHPLLFFKALLSGDTATAQAALYNDSS